MDTKLWNDVSKMVGSHAQDYDDGAAGFVNDLRYSGCQSGLVGELVYYHDTLKFYKNHKKAISDLLADTLDNSGIDSPAELFGDKWNKLDPLAMDIQNQNLLSWFAFEEVAFQLIPE